jgi:hypothetical protein
MGRGIGNVLGTVAPIAAGAMFPGFGTTLGLGSGIAAGALAGAGIAALSGGDILSGGLMGGLGGYGGGGLSGATSAAKQAAQGQLTDAAANQLVTKQAIQQAGQVVPSGITGTTGQLGANLGQVNTAAGTTYTAGGGSGLTGGTINQAYRPDFMATTSANMPVREAAFGTDYGMSDIAKNLGEGSTAMGYGKMGLTGLGALSSMPVETQTWDSVKDKYDPNSRLNLNMDTGIDEALRKDSGLRLYNQGGRVQRYEEGGLTLNLNTGETQGERASLMPPPTVPGLFGQQRVDPSFKAYDPNKDKLTLAPAGAQGGSSSMYGFYDVSGKFNQTDANSPNAQLYNYGPQETTAQQNQGGAGGPQSFSGNQGGVDPVTAIAALRAAQGSAAQQEAPYKNQTLGLSSLAGGGYLETGGVVGDGMSDEIPATIDGEQEARLSDGEFVLPADIVSHLGNGSSDAGAKQLYSMMDRIRQARTGSKKQGTEIDVGRYMPA